MSVSNRRKNSLRFCAQVDTREFVFIYGTTIIYFLSIPLRIKIGFPAADQGISIVRISLSNNYPNSIQLLRDKHHSK